MIYHITTQRAWEAAKQAGEYTSPSLENEGFIHLSKAEQVIAVANAVYRGKTNLLLLCVEEEKLQAELKWEAPSQPEHGDPVPVAEDDLFPHLYGALNLDAVARTVDFPAKADGTFDLPESIN